MDEAAMQHADSVQQMFASLAAQTAELQRQMAATLQQQQQQQSASQQQQQQPPSPDSTSQDSREYRAEGITMPKFSGTKDDDVADYLFSAKLYFESKNIKYGADSPQQRPLSLLVANLKGPAAAWYREYVSRDGDFLHSVTQFEELLTGEFTTPDRQEHLRDQLLRLRQNRFTCLEDYVSAFRHIICKVEDMSDIDKVMHVQKGLVVEIRQEVKLRVDAMTQVPWDALLFLAGEIYYGGRVTGEFGRRCLMAVLRRFCSETCFSSKPRNVRRESISIHGLTTAFLKRKSSSTLQNSVFSLLDDSFFAPEFQSEDEMVGFVDALPDMDGPHVFGMHPNAHISYQRQVGQEFVKLVLQLQPQQTNVSDTSTGDAAPKNSENEVSDPFFIGSQLEQAEVKV